MIIEVNDFGEWSKSLHKEAMEKSSDITVQWHKQGS